MGSCSSPGQKLVSSWGPTEAGLSSGGWLQDWRLESASLGYWEHTEATGSSWRWRAGIHLASQSEKEGGSNKQPLHLVSTDITMGYCFSAFVIKGGN